MEAIITNNLNRNNVREFAQVSYRSNVYPFRKNISIKNTSKNNSKSRYTSDGRKKANAASPIRNVEDIQKLEQYFLSTGHYRDYLLFVLGNNTGRRCGDLVTLKISDVYDFKNDCVLDKIVFLREEKTGKRFPYMFLNDNVRDAIETYLCSLATFPPCDDFLFKSQIRNRRTSVHASNAGHITVASYWRILNNAAKAVGIDMSKQNVGTHTMRKTFGYHKYQHAVDSGDISVLSKLMVIYNHSSEQITSRYIGIEEDEMKEFMLSCPV